MRRAMAFTITSTSTRLSWVLIAQFANNDTLCLITNGAETYNAKHLHIPQTTIRPASQITQYPIIFVSARKGRIRPCKVTD